MNKRENREHIQDALNTALSGLQDDPWLAQRVIAEAKKEKKEKRAKRIPSTVLALLLAILLLGSTVAYAGGFDFIQYVASWIGDVLNITGTMDYPETMDDNQNPSGKSDRGAAADMKEVMQELEVQPHLPQWIPEGFCLADLSCYSIGPSVQAVDAYYRHDSDGEFFITVQAIGAGTTFSMNVERNEDEYAYVLHTQKGDYYFVKNMERHDVSWFDQNCWIVISGTLSEVELLRMIDSLYE